MSLGQLLASGAAAVFNPGMFLMVCVAIILGTIFGALPGVSATMAVALGLTFTYTMEPIPAIVFLVAIYCSSITGGSITAILFKIPGVPSSAPTTFDGYPMAQRGEAGKALGVALLASAIGGLFSAIAMFLLSQPLTKAALQFGPSDLFAVTFMGLSILTCLDSDHILTCIISGLLGLLMACVGQDKMYAVQRLPLRGGRRFRRQGQHEDAFPQGNLVDQVDDAALLHRRHGRRHSAGRGRDHRFLHVLHDGDEALQASGEVRHRHY